MELTTEKIEELVREARDSGYPVVKLLSDGSIGHYFDKQSGESESTLQSVIVLERDEVIRNFDDGSFEWGDFVYHFALEIWNSLGEVF